jgi:hypothetical protein
MTVWTNHGEAENCFSMNAVTKRGIAAVKSETPRTR